MADMTIYEMLDDINLSITEAHITAKTKAVAGYVNGKFANWPAIVAKYGRTGLFLLSIDVQGNPSVGAQCLDVERFDATIDQAPSWVKATRAEGLRVKDLREYPKVYIQESNAQALTAKMNAAGVKRDEYMLWTAHYTGNPHICGPKTCGCPVQADATQWTSTFEGASLDASECYGYFFTGPKGVAPGRPEGLKAEASYRGVDLFWTAVPGATGYDVQLIQGTREAGRLQVTESKAAFPVEPGTVYDWRVAALPGGEWSAESSFKTPDAPVTVPEAPVTPVASAPVASPAPEVPKPSEAPVSPVIDVPEPAAEPAPVTDGSKGVLVYVQEILDAEVAKLLGLPAGTILFIPHTVEGA